MVELQLDRIEKQLRRRARAAMWFRVVLLALVGQALQMAVWTSRGSAARHVRDAVPLAMLEAAALVAIVRRGRRPAAMMERLRRDPRVLEALTLHWVAELGGTRGQLGFQFREGASLSVSLPTETARLVFLTLRVAYPWTRALVGGRAEAGGR
jgi:hypothetical protein